MDWLLNTPGRLYVVGTLLPLAAFALLLAFGALRALCRPFRQKGGTVATLYWALGGDTPARGGAYLATAFMALAAACGVAGITLFLTDEHTGAEHAARWGERIDWVRLGPLDTAAPPAWEARYREWERRDEGRGVPQPPAPPVALALELGYRIDHLTAVMFAMVTVVATLIFVFSLGYMHDETKETVEDHEVTLAHTHTHTHTDPHNAHSLTPTHYTDPHDTHSGSPASAEAGSSNHHLHRRGRFGRFFLYLSLFSFSMLNLVIADNLFQVFVSWELVGVCSFFLIGFYYERPSASRAANKAFIVNRVGDAGFLVGILIAWSYLGTLNFEEMQRRVRSPAADAHGNVALADKLVRVNVEAGGSRLVVPPRDSQSRGTHLALFPVSQVGHFDALGYSGHRGTPRDLPRPQTYTDFGAIPYYLFVLMGIGIFLGCAGKSAQVPLQTWLPDAMEGPTPVSALIHAATMVAAGVYLVGRCHPLFAPEVLLVIAYVGAATLFTSATIALVQTDIKRVLAYSTCSQLGFMMLALGIGGWVAGLLHLITHAFFKALLFLCSGSVIHGCHHEQDLRKMGGLRSKMPLTAFTMLVGVLAIAGAPLLSGWYSKDMILSSALAFATVHPAHGALFVLPLVTAAMTAYYMFRLWFLAFTGPPRDAHIHTRAHESPAVMTAPLLVLAVFSVCVAWGWPLWSADASALGHVLEKAQPASVPADYFAERTKEHDVHVTAGLAALIAAVVGAGIAFAVFGRRQPSADALHARGPAWYRFLLRKWYFDEVYDATLVKPTVALARAAAAADKRPTEGTEAAAKRVDFFTLDGLLNAVGQLAAGLGGFLRRAQTGRVRTYVAALALTAAAMLGMLAVLSR